MFGLGAPELLLIFLAVLILFGAPKLPEFARSVGKAMRIFRDEANSMKREIEAATEPIKEATQLDTAPETTAKPSTDASSASSVSTAIDVEGNLEPKKG
jgi:sec-independent protein translocase protein TatA